MAHRRDSPSGNWRQSLPPISNSGREVPMHVVYDFPPKPLTDFPQRAGILMPINNVVFGLEGHDEVLIIAPDRYPSPRTARKRRPDFVGYR